MARDDVAAELVAEPQRPLEVDPPPVRPGGRGCGRRWSAPRLGREVDVEPGAVAGGPAVDHRQADAVAGDRGADGDPAGADSRSGCARAGRPGARGRSIVPMSVTIPVNIAPFRLAAPVRVLARAPAARQDPRSRRVRQQLAAPAAISRAGLGRRKSLSFAAKAGEQGDNEAIDAGSADRDGELRARASPGGGARRLRPAALRPDRRRDQARRQRPGATTCTSST